MNPDLVIFGLVLAARLLLPLGILRRPLPFILICFVLDAADQTLFQSFARNLPLDSYQSYDKALDVFYLTVAYIATLRNWENLAAFRISRFLYYYRLVGVVLFEWFRLRPLLLIFPNTFEYFFIYYEIVRLRYNPRRIARRSWLLAAAGIWILVKLPQEWWIHVRQGDTTDAIASLAANAPGVLFLIVALIAIAAFLIHRFGLRRLPPFTARVRLTVASLAPRLQLFPPQATPFFNAALLEKVVLVGCVTVIFARLTGATNGTLEIIAAVGLLVVANALLSALLARRGLTPGGVIAEFVLVLGLNLVTVWVYSLLAPGRGVLVNLPAAWFFVLLLSLIIALFDWYHAIFVNHYGLPPRQRERA
jgi:hypothetical protein